MEVVGKVVPRDHVPLPRQGTAAIVDWDTYAQLARSKPGEMVLVAKKVRESTQKSLRQRDRYPFVDDKGRVKIVARGGERDETGVLYSDIYFRFDRA